MCDPAPHTVRETNIGGWETIFLEKKNGTKLCKWRSTGIFLRALSRRVHTHNVGEEQAAHITHP